LAGALVAAAAVLAAPFVYFAVRLADQPVHHPLQPIAISARSCPAVQSIASAAQAFEYAWFDADMSSASWTTSRAKLEAALVRLDRTLARGTPSLPVAVRARLEVVRTNARRGIVAVRASTSFGDADRRGYAELNVASAAYGQATTLVGDACDSLYVMRGPRVTPSPGAVREFAGLADWVCGVHRERCPTTTTTQRPAGR
jgi:hypothetical protein